MPADAEFQAAFTALDSQIRDACAGVPDWQEKVAAGIRTAVEFAAGEPQVAVALTVEDGKSRSGPDGRRHPELIAHYANLLGDVVPADDRFAPTEDESLVRNIVILVDSNLRCGTTDRLRELAPDIVHMTLLPLAGFADAQRWSEAPPPSPS